MQHVLQVNNISHVVNLLLHAQGNSKFEYFHRTLLDVMYKKVRDSPISWDIHLSQVLGAIIMNTNESPKLPPFTYYIKGPSTTYL